MTLIHSNILEFYRHLCHPLSYKSRVLEIIMLPTLPAFTSFIGHARIHCLSSLVASAVLTYVATVAWPQGPALLGAPRFCPPHFQNLLCAFSSARHVHHDPRNLISLNHTPCLWSCFIVFFVIEREEVFAKCALECAPRVWKGPRDWLWHRAPRLVNAALAASEWPTGRMWPKRI